MDEITGSLESRLRQTVGIIEQALNWLRQCDQRIDQLEQENEHLRQALARKPSDG